MREQAWFVYIIQTRCGQLYTGISTDPKRRFEEHLQTYQKLPGAKGAKYFRGREPVAIVLIESLASRPDALKRELALKALSRKEKQALIASYNPT